MRSLHRDTPSFIIDSEDRIQGTNENFTVSVHLKPNNNYDMCCLIHAGIPKTFYNIDTQNNQLIIRENGIQRSTSLPPGNYTHLNLQPVFSSVLNALSLSNNPASPWTYSIIWNSLTVKWEISVTEHAGRPMTSDSGIAFLNHQTHDLLGFNDDTIYLYTINAGIGTTSSQNTPNFELTSYISIKSNVCNNEGNNDPDSAVLARIPVHKTNFNDVLVYDLLQLDDGAKRIANNKSNIYNFAIFDDHDRPIRLNGRGWYITLFMYEHNVLPLRELQKMDREEERIRQTRERSIETINPDAGLDIKAPLVTNIDIIDTPADELLKIS